MSGEKNKTYEEIYRVARDCASKNIKCSGSDLTTNLQRKDLRTQYGTCYVKGGRGVFSAIAAAYRYVEARYGEEEADKIAFTFINAKGEYAYKKKV